MVNVVTIAACRWICWLKLIGLVQRLAAICHYATYIRWIEWTLAVAQYNNAQYNKHIIIVIWWERAICIYVFGW